MGLYSPRMGWLDTLAALEHPDARRHPLQVPSLCAAGGLYGIALDRIKQGLCVFDGQQRLVMCNRRYATMYGLHPDALRPGMTLREVVTLRHLAGRGPKMGEEQFTDWRAHIAISDRVLETEVELMSGEVFSIYHEPMPGGGWVATHEDVTERRQAEQRIRHMAHHDSLTGLPNRVLFADRLQHAVDRLTRPDAMIAVLCLDLDRFKEVNDTYGHQAGDDLLQQVVGRVSGQLRGSDTFARLGGDEFAVILDDMTEPDEVAGLAARISRSLAVPFALDNHEVQVGISIGIALGHTPDRPDPGMLLRCADIALYRAKAEGRGTYRFFELGMDERLRHRKRMERDLRRAVAENQLHLHFQPQFDILTGRISGAEALVRWMHPEQGMISPGDFIPLAEECGLIVQIGAWVLRTACQVASGWGELRLSVNLSPVQVRDSGLPRLITEVLAATSLPPGRLELEVTEGVLMHETPATLATLEYIRGLGVSIALDDFGTGYSSLSYLRRFPFDKIKIDRSFVATIGQDAAASAIVQAVITLGRTLGMRVNAEGIETDAQLRMLQDAGCDEAQGFLLARPMPAPQLDAAYAGEMSNVRVG